MGSTLGGERRLPGSLWTNSEGLHVAALYGVRNRGERLGAGWR